MRTDNPTGELARLVSALGTMALGAILLASPANAQSTQQEYREHTARCIQLFFTDPVAHALECLPSRIFPDNSSLSTLGPANAPPYTPPATSPTAPEPEPEPEPECPESGCPETEPEYCEWEPKEHTYESFRSFKPEQNQTFSFSSSNQRFGAPPSGNQNFSFGSPAPRFGGPPSGNQTFSGQNSWGSSRQSRWGSN